jgi:hypothetical protein
MKDLFHDLEYDIFLSQFCTILEMINSFMEIILNLKMVGLVWNWWCLMPLSTYISAISWRSVLLMEETGVPGENHQPVVSHWQTLSHNVVDLALIDWFLVFNATFRNISAISWRPVLVVEEAGVSGEILHGQVTGKLYHLRLRVECTLFLFTKPGAIPRHIGDRLVWVVR